MKKHIYILMLCAVFLPLFVTYTRTGRIAGSIELALIVLVLLAELIFRFILKRHRDAIYLPDIFIAGFWTCFYLLRLLSAFGYIAYDFRGMGTGVIEIFSMLIIWKGAVYSREHGVGSPGYRAKNARRLTEALKRKTSTWGLSAVHIKTKLDVNELSEKILSKITSIDESFQNGSEVESIILGGMRGRRFWLQKTRPGYNSEVQRYFDGVITDTPSGAGIKGRFKLTHMYKLALVVSIILIIVVCLLQNFAKGEALTVIWEDDWLIPVISASLISIYTIVYYLIGILSYRKERKALILLLKSLANDNGGDEAQ